MPRLVLLALLLPLAACDLYGLPAGSGPAVTPSVAPDLSDATLVTGVLTRGDAMRAEGIFQDVVAAVTVPPGGKLEVMLESDAFDTYLLVELVGTERVLTNDDFNGSRAQSLIVQPNPGAEPVEARIVASSFAAGATGAYRLRYAVREAPPTPEGVALRPGTASGELTAATAAVPLLAAGTPRRAVVYTATLQGGVPATIRMESAAFDPYLRVQRVGQPVAYNDDFQGSRSVSQVTFTPAATGDYTVYAGTFSETGRGAFSLALSTGSAPPAALPPGASRVDGALTDGDGEVALTLAGDRRKADAYTLELRAGQVLTAELQSTAFDTYLMLAQGEAALARNDDAGGTQRSALTFTAPATGAYTLYAGTFTAAGRGAYTLSYTIR